MTQAISETVARDVVSRVARVLLYSDNAATRREVREAVGDQIGRLGTEIAWVEAATPAVALAEAVGEAFDLLILDGEAGKFGGMGIAKSVEDEVPDPPPSLLLTARPEDAWLGTWAGATMILAYPAEPFVVRRTVTRLLSDDA
jgi:DNA-binding response OmpR family regulator